MFSLARSLVFALLAFLQPSYADYYIDDTNSTLYYSTSAEVWGAFNASTILTLLLPNGTYMPVNPYACYNNT
ncbi:hypothetical protein SCLCIDRAFT_1221339 [Scleroderma citrinum Foug A]|uniref:Uncharacterized protein n=1 Tax=Scleroderma citrinum Foug A TaxID=1036808 RepID=A0A0C3DGJ6_9AGAM|nr:hypothetical protein SCLCIDRAFT_1221339 [Scleroderma citrinum Foug A]